MNKRLLTVILICAAAVLIGMILFISFNSVPMPGYGENDDPPAAENYENHENYEDYQPNGEPSEELPGETETPQGEPPARAGAANNNGAANGGAAVQQEIELVNLSITGLDGAIIPNMEVPFLGQGMTVYHALTMAAAFRSIDIRTRGSGRNVYIAEIDGLAEFGHGPMSGWIFYVNGTRSGVGAGAYELSEGDTIEWRYTTTGVTAHN